MRKHLIIASVVALIVLASAWLWYSQKTEPIIVKHSELELDRVEKAHRIVLFIHGTFGSTLGLLDIPSIMKDNLKGSLYTKTARSMRKDRFFFCTQPLLHRGLESFVPTFDRSSDDGGFVVYPIGKCFEHLAHRVWGDDEIRHYYVFGWSGLLSQNKRRHEAVRLLNELNEEVKKFKARGVLPKITIVSHSHGGNVVLNMGLIAAELLGHSFPQIPEFEHAESIIKTRDLLNHLPQSGSVAGLASHKRWDYYPEKPEWKVEHFVLLGTPIQPETDFAVTSPLFESVLNCYSHADRVQQNDWISTSRYYSDRRFDRVVKLLEKHGQDDHKKLTQACILFNRSRGEDGLLVYSADGEKTKKKRTIWNTLIGDLSTPTVHVDPTHKELWFVVTPAADEKTFLKPLPVAVLMPLLLKAQQTSPLCHDCDYNIAVRGDELCIEVAPYLKGTVQETLSLPLSEIKMMQKALGDWEVSSDFLEREELLLSSHVRVGREC